MMKVAILGAGMAAAYARAACRDWYFENNKIGLEACHIYSNKKQAPPKGAMYLREVPAFVLEDERVVASRISVSILNFGDAETYVKKQWGDVPVTSVTSSFGVDKIDTGYEPSVCYSVMMEGVNLHQVTGKMSDEDIAELSKKYDIVFMTFPTEKSTKYCNEKNYLIRTPTVSYEEQTLVFNYIMYNGQPGPMVRISKLWGRLTVEYVWGHIPDVGERGIPGNFWDLHPLTPEWDPTDTSAPNVLLIGRYATLNRHLLSHEVYHTALEALRNF